MNRRTIKLKITLWYTGIIIVTLSIAICGALFASQNYSIDNMKEELRDEVGDLQEDINNYPAYFPDTELLAYYDDGVMLSIYNEDFEMINGITPDDFPMDYPFDGTRIHELSKGEDHWYIFDKKVRISDENIWIRGVHSYSSIALMIERLTRWIALIFPVLVFFTAFVGYKMISRSLKPVTKIADTANAIAESSDLSLRLPETNKNDELKHLSDTFNNMLDRVEEQFQREKQFVSDAAHELRTPVSVMMSHCEYLMQDLDLDKEQLHEAEILYDKINHMASLVDALLVISRIEKKSYKLNEDNINLTTLAESVVCEMEKDSMKKNITLKLSDYLTNCEFTGDMTLIVQLFSNLISNGIKYGKEGGYVNITLRESNGLIQISFEDDGIGIPEDKINYIWNRFYQVNNSRSDTDSFGLGLFMVKRIVELHKGSVEVSSVEGKGSVFIVTLPRRQ